MTDKPQIPGNLDFSDGFAFEIALSNHPPEVVCEQWNVSRDTYQLLDKDPIFRAVVERYTQKIAESGTTVQLRASVMLGHSLPVLHSIVHDVTADNDTRIRAIDRIASLAGEKNNTSDGNAPTLTISLDMGNGAEVKEINPNMPALELNG